MEEYTIFRRSCDPSFRSVRNGEGGLLNYKGTGCPFWK